MMELINAKKEEKIIGITGRINGVDRALSRWAAPTAGVSRTINGIYGAVDGAQRQLFTGITRWKRYSTLNYFSGVSSSTIILWNNQSYPRYLDNYRESGTETVKHFYLNQGDYFIHENEDYYLREKDIYGSKASKVTSYTVKQNAYIDTVESTNPDAYPANGAQGGYWYVKI